MQTSWAYGVTTVPTRFDELLPRTLQSLRDGGFPSPHIFVDGGKRLPASLGEYNTTYRNPPVRTFGNWILSLWELHVRCPGVDRYAIFQDDMVTYKNLRQYLDQCMLPYRGYWNLYTFPQNVQAGRSGWYHSDQQGMGAVGLVFTGDGVRTLLQHKKIVNKPLDSHRGWKAVDGAVIDTMKLLGWKEYVHNPSLVQHIGIYSSSMGSEIQPGADTFRGESFDAMNLLSAGVKV